VFRADNEQCIEEEAAMAWWYNHKTGETEEGPQSLGSDRDGPFDTREEAERAPEIAAARAQQWREDDDKDNS
jgi:hypothetical protein